jgi:folate-binding protein YgfZ
MAERTPLAERTAGAALVEEGGFAVPAHFGAPDEEYRAARSGAALFDVSHRGKLEVAGGDALAFLHNLASNDVRNLAPGAGCETFLCTAKARVVAHALVWRAPPQGKRDTLALDLAPGSAARVLQHLNHFLISEDVQLTDRTRELAQVHLAGPDAPAVLGRAFGTNADLPLLQERSLTLAGELPVRLRRNEPLGLPGFDVLCPSGRAGEVWQRLLEAGARPAGMQAYQLLRVEAGTPLYGVDLDENTFAPEVGRTRQAISYTKGCYLGQEPIVMARDRGQVNRTLLGLKLPEGTVPAGSLLYRDGKEVGRVTSSVVSPALNGAIALAYVRRGNQEAGTTLEVDVGGQRRPAVVTALPFVA